MNHTLYPRSCQHQKTIDPALPSEVYTIQIGAGDSFQVYCDMETARGGWTLVSKGQFTVAKRLLLTSV